MWLFADGAKVTKTTIGMSAMVIVKVVAQRNVAVHHNVPAIPVHSCLFEGRTVDLVESGFVEGELAGWGFVFLVGKLGAEFSDATYIIADCTCSHLPACEDSSVQVPVNVGPRYLPVMLFQ